MTMGKRRVAARIERPDLVRLRRPAESGGLGATRHAQFLEHLMHVIFDGRFSDVECSSDLLVGESAF
jgi:hypothetical protein